MLHTSKRAHRIGLTVHFPYSLPLKMAARIRKYAEICRNCLPSDVTCTPSIAYSDQMQLKILQAAEQLVCHPLTDFNIHVGDWTIAWRKAGSTRLPPTSCVGRIFRLILNPCHVSPAPANGINLPLSPTIMSLNKWSNSPAIL